METLNENSKESILIAKEAYNEVFKRFTNKMQELNPIDNLEEIEELIKEFNLFTKTFELYNSNAMTLETLMLIQSILMNRMSDEKTTTIKQ